MVHGGEPMRCCFKDSGIILSQLFRDYNKPLQGIPLSVRLAGERKDLYSCAGNDDERSARSYLGFNAIIFMEGV